VLKYLAPGKIIPFQDNQDLSMMTTADLLAKDVTIIANRDGSNHASGNVFLDQGELVSELLDHEYEWYTFILNGKSLQKQILNEHDAGFKMHSLIILNASDLQDTEFACY